MKEVLNQRGSVMFKLIMGFGVVLVLAFLFSLGGQKSQQRDPYIDACYASRQFVRANLKAPDSAEFPLCEINQVTMTAPNQFIVKSFVTAQNSFGAKLRKPYKCEVLYIPSQKGHMLISLKLD